MAVTKIHPVKSTLKKALDYICNPEKTDEKILISSFGCAYETADIEFGFTLSQSIDKGNNLAHHLIQSFEPDEVGYEEAHAIGKQLADEILKGKHEYVLTTHIDKGHVHNHILFCAADMVDHRKYISNRRSYYNIRNASDRLCGEHGLSVIKPSAEKGKSYKEYTAAKEGKSWKAQLKIAMDAAIPRAKDYEDFLKRMELAGYEIKRGKYTSFRAAGQERFTRSKTLGEDYAEDVIRERIQGKKHRISAPKRDDKKINLLIDIQNSIKAQESGGYAHWAKINNLKQAAKTLNYLTENGIQSIEQLQAKIAEASAATSQVSDGIKAVEKRMADIAVLIKNITTYRQTKPVHDEYRQGRNREQYRQQHEGELILHEAAKKALNTYPSGNLPSVQTLRAEYEKLSQEKDRLYQQYGERKKQDKQLDTIRQNVEQLVGRQVEPDKAKGRDTEL